MPSIVIGTPYNTSTQAQKKMTIRSENGSVLVTVPYAPTEVSHDGYSNTYATDDRPGRTPLNTEAGKGLRSFSATIVLGYRDLQQSVEAVINGFANLVNADQRIVVSYGPQEAGLWYLTGFSVDSTQRSASTNEITRATCDIEFTQASAYVVNVGPASGGVKPVSTPTPAATTTPTSSGTFYTVKKGDTLSSIAIQFYHDAGAYTKIADANSIRNVNLISVGQKLRIP